MVDLEGARALARGLTSLAAAAEAAFDRRDRAAAAAVKGWSGPLGLELARRTAVEAEDGREIVAELRAEAAAWLAAASRAEAGRAVGGVDGTPASGGEGDVAASGSGSADMPAATGGGTAEGPW